MNKDILVNIFYYLSDLDLIRASFVNKLFNQIINDNNFWININDSYRYAKFNIYNSIRTFFDISNKINTVQLPSCMLSCCDETINMKCYDTDDVPYIWDSDKKCCTKIKYFDYLVLKTEMNSLGNGLYPSTIIQMYNRYTKTKTIINDDKIDGVYKNIHISYEVYGNYIWCSEIFTHNYCMRFEKKICEIYAFNIMTGIKYFIRDIDQCYYFKRKYSGLFFKKNIKLEIIKES